MVLIFFAVLKGISTEEARTVAAQPKVDSINPLYYPLGSAK